MPVTSFSSETPWLCWSKWREVQTYGQANPPWFKAFTSIWTDEKYRAVWEPHGDAGFALVHRLMHHMAAHSTTGIVWGDPALLERELRLTAPPDLSWLLAAGWILYIGDEEKARREAPAAPKAKRKAPAKRKSKAAPKSKKRADRGEERRGEEETETKSVPCGAASTNNSSTAAIAAPPGTREKEPESQPEAQAEPQDATGRADTLSLVSSLPSPILATVGLPGGSAALPPESDLRGAGPPRHGNPSPGSFNPRAGPRLLGDCLGPLAMARQCPEVWDWVSSVFKLLRFGFAIDSNEGRRECGSFTAAYNKVLNSPMPLGEKNKILVSSLKTAEQKGRKPQGYYRKGKGAVFCSVLNQRLEKHLALVGAGSAYRGARSTAPSPPMGR